MKSLREIQGEVGAWARAQFGQNVSKDGENVSYEYPLGSLPPLLGMGEELGELYRVVARRHQGRGYNPEEAQDAKEDALADLLVFMCDFACREGIDLQATLNRVWEKVCQRRQPTWAADKAAEGKVTEKFREAAETEGGCEIAAGARDPLPRGAGRAEVAEGWSRCGPLFPEHLSAEAPPPAPSPAPSSTPSPAPSSAEAPGGPPAGPGRASGSPGVYSDPADDA